MESRQFHNIVRGDNGSNRLFFKMNNRLRHPLNNALEESLTSEKRSELIEVEIRAKSSKAGEYNPK